MWDESYSSERAAEIIRANRKKSSGHHDDVAAASFLQDYLDALRGQEHEPGQALETFAEVK